MDVTTFGPHVPLLCSRDPVTGYVEPPADRFFVDVTTFGPHVPLLCSRDPVNGYIEPPTDTFFTFIVFFPGGGDLLIAWLGRLVAHRHGFSTVV